MHMLKIYLKSKTQKILHTQRNCLIESNTNIFVSGAKEDLDVLVIVLASTGKSFFFAWQHFIYVKYNVICVKILN